MDFLKGLFGMLTSSVLRLVVTAGTLVAVYFFIVKPVLDTNNKAIDSANSYSSGVQSNIGREIQRSIRQTNRRVQRPDQQVGAPVVFQLGTPEEAAALRAARARQREPHPAMRPQILMRRLSPPDMHVPARNAPANIS